jgi:hypothetical protein
MIGRGNRSTRRKPAPVPLCPPQTPHAARTRTRVAAVGSQHLTVELRHGLHGVLSSHLGRDIHYPDWGFPRFFSVPSDKFQHSVSIRTRPAPSQFFQITHLSSYKFAAIYTTYWQCRVSRLRAGRPRGRSWSPGGIKNFLFSKSTRPNLGPTQPPIQWVPGAFSPGAKRRGRESDHLRPSNAEVKKMCIHISTPPYVFVA